MLRTMTIVPDGVQTLTAPINLDGLDMSGTDLKRSFQELVLDRTRRDPHRMWLTPLPQNIRIDATRFIVSASVPYIYKHPQNKGK